MKTLKKTKASINMKYFQLIRTIYSITKSIKGTIKIIINHIISNLYLFNLSMFLLVFLESI